MLYGLRVEVNLLLAVLSSRTVFGVMTSCRGGTEVESLTLESGVTEVNFSITHGQAVICVSIQFSVSAMASLWVIALCGRR
jgi:hypothetical protein